MNLSLLWYLVALYIAYRLGQDSGKSAYTRHLLTLPKITASPQPQIQRGLDNDEPILLTRSNIATNHVCMNINGINVCTFVTEPNEPVSILLSASFYQLNAETKHEVLQLIHIAEKSTLLKVRSEWKQPPSEIISECVHKVFFPNNITSELLFEIYCQGVYKVFIKSPQYVAHDEPILIGKLMTKDGEEPQFSLISTIRESLILKRDKEHINTLIRQGARILQKNNSPDVFRIELYKCWPNYSSACSPSAICHYNTH